MDSSSLSGEEKNPRFNIDTLREPRNLAISTFVVGLLIGLVALGWWLFPVQWENASITELRPDLQEDYLRMVIDSYNLRQDEEVSQRRLAELGDAAPDLLSTIAANPGDQSELTITRFETLLGITSPIDQAEPDAGIDPGSETEGDEPASTSLFDTQSLLLTLCGVTLVLGLALATIYYVRRRQSESGGASSASKASTQSTGTSSTDFATLADSAPLSQWMTTYLLGDDLFDDSFSIDSVAGEFLGECGVGIAETIGVGDPKRVSAFEIWLFDKNDIQTVTKVLMSNHTFRDDSARDRLSAKGEPVLAIPGAEAVLETETLQLVARVVDMDYGEGALPEESFFERATIELAVWSKI
jgi:hypothetical protein